MLKLGDGLGGEGTKLETKILFFLFTYFWAIGFSQGHATQPPKQTISPIFSFFWETWVENQERSQIFSPFSVKHQYKIKKNQFTTLESNLVLIGKFKFNNMHNFLCSCAIRTFLFFHFLYTFSFSRSCIPLSEILHPRL